MGVAGIFLDVAAVCCIRLDYATVRLVSDLVFSQLSELDVAFCTRLNSPDSGILGRGAGACAGRCSNFLFELYLSVASFAFLLVLLFSLPDKRPGV